MNNGEKHLIHILEVQNVNKMLLNKINLYEAIY